MTVAGFEFHPLEVEDDVGHVFDYARKVANSCCAAIDFHRGDGRRLQGMKEALGGVNFNGVTVTGFKRLGGKLA